VSTPTPGARVAALYDASAVAYARHWAPALHRHSRDLVVGLPAPPPGGRTVVDVAAGTGDLLADLRGVAGPRGSLVALDRSLGMLRRIDGGTPRAQSDAARLPLRDRSVDVVVQAFVLFLLPDAAAAVREAARVLRPSGHLLAATWGEQHATRADEVVQAVLTEAGAPEPDLPARSDEVTDSPPAMARLLEGAGLEAASTRSRPLDAAFTAEGFAEMRTTCGVTGWRFAQLDPDARSAAVAELAARLAGLRRADLVDRSEVLLTTARLPG
jgi:SAM-dependent methyltransferase